MDERGVVRVEADPAIGELGGDVTVGEQHAEQPSGSGGRPICCEAALRAADDGRPTGRHRGTVTAYTVEELDVPATMDDDPARVRAFCDWLAVSDAAEEAVHGLPELSWKPAEYLPMCHEPGAPSRLFVVRDGRGAVVAAGSYDSKTEPGTTNCWLFARRPPRSPASCIGSLLADHLEALARSEGRTQWKTYAVSRQVGAATGPGFVQAPTGAGAVRRTRQGCASSPVAAGGSDR